MTSRVTIVDYGSGNLFSVTRAFERCGAQVILAQSAAEIAAAERLVLPGVGAFVACRDHLVERDLWHPVIDFARSGRPFLGICVGMQLMLEASEEFGVHEGFGLVAGRVAAIPDIAPDGRRIRIPHVGWNALHPSGNARNWRNGVLDGIEVGSSVYFVHSFAAKPQDRDCVLATCDYEGIEICAAIQIGNVYGLQFHPEKSGPVGLRIISNFAALIVSPRVV